MVLAVALSGVAAGVRADGEHSRRLAAEIVITIGDARRLADPATPSLHQRGLRQRIGGALVGLGLLIRRARQERPLPLPPIGWRDRLREALAAADMARLMGELEILSGLYPIDLKGILPARPTPGRLRLGKELHDEVCAACHDSPDTEVALPAFNLTEQVQSMSQREFAARMISGLRGDAVANLQNPFSDEDLAALIAFYRQGKP